MDHTTSSHAHARTRLSPRAGMGTSVPLNPAGPPDRCHLGGPRAILLPSHSRQRTIPTSTSIHHFYLLKAASIDLNPAPLAQALKPPPSRQRQTTAIAITAAATSAGSAGPAPEAAPNASSPLVCEVQKATSAAELRAAAFLRAVSFYTYPLGRSEYAARSHRHMKANAEWDAVTAKVEGRDVAYRDLDVTCFIATVDDVEGPATTRNTTSSGPSNAAHGGAWSTHHPAAARDVPPQLTAIASSSTAAAQREHLLSGLRSCLDACAQLPAEPPTGTRVGDPALAPPGGCPRRLVVGSLDLNVGHTLPSEELIGRYPQEDPRHRRAYLSNVCVAPAARRMGVARALLSHVEGVARGAGVEWLYVHVVAENAPAVALYCAALGFQVEQSEPEATARALQRPRRLLLAKSLRTGAG